MLHIVVIENIFPDFETIGKVLKELLPDARVSTVASVNEATQWFETNALPDLIITTLYPPADNFLDWMEAKRLSVPVIYFSSSTELAKRAFHNNGIAYLLKPVTPGLLANAIKKYFSMRRFFEEKMEHHLESLIYPPRYSQRIIVRKGREYQSIRMQDIVCFYSKFKMIHLLTLDGREYRTLKDNLNQLAITLNPDTFFKANRKYIVHIDHIRQFRILDFGKVLIEMCLPVKGEIIVSQFSGMRFRQWIGENNESRHLTGTQRYLNNLH